MTTTTSAAKEENNNDNAQQLPLEEIIKHKDISSGQIIKNKRKIVSEIIKEKIKAGADEKTVEKEVNELVTEVIKEKQAEEQYVPQEFNYDFMKASINDSFLGTLSMSVSKVPDLKAPTAYVSARPYGHDYEIIMGFNPKWFRNLTPLERQGIIKHEMYHLVFQHIFDRAIGDKNYAFLYNLATDMAINSIIGKDNLPEQVIIPGHRPLAKATATAANNNNDAETQDNPYADYIANAPPMKCSDHYFEELKKIKQKEDKKGNENSIEIAIGQGLGSIDDHSGWDELPDEVKDLVKDKVNDLLEKAVTNAEKNNDWGSVPSEIQSVIKKILSKEVDWTSIVKNFAGRCRTTDRQSTIRRINKKNPYNFPGVKRKYITKFVVFGDQSGSMSNDDIAKLFSELEGLAKTATFDFYAFDTEIALNSHTEWKKGKPHPKLERTKCGGTDFSCISTFLNSKENKGKYGGCFVLTDGYAPVMPQVLGTRILWVITEDGTMDSIRPSDLVCKMGSGEKQFKKY